MNAAKRQPQVLFWLLAAGLVILIWAVFGRALGYGFVSYDDSIYVYRNPLVTAGLTWRGVVWAFTSIHASSWHPLTTLSHMLDCQVFGLRAGGHHFTNLLLHTAAAGLLFFWLQEITRRVWRSALVAALFAIHPLRVESVVWIAERKDVLSGLFFILTLLAYVHYARNRSAVRYATVLLLFALGLMSKPMLVTLPVVLLLLDYWPLERCKTVLWSRLILEKVPLLILSAGSAAVAFVAQLRSPGASEQLPFLWRMWNAIVSYVIYLGQMFWPANLAALYPHPENRLSVWLGSLSAALLLAVTAAAIVYRRSRPYLLTGWLWFLIMLLPVIGLIGVGLQGHADRYTYLPQIGLYIAVIWLVGSFRVPLPVAAAAAMAALVSLSVVTWRQTAYWSDSETLWKRALAVTRNNDVAHANLAMLLVERGDVDTALTHLGTALEIREGMSRRHHNLTLALIHTNFGYALMEKNEIDEAIGHFRAAITLQPDYPDAHFNLGGALMQKGEGEEALREWEQTIALRPDDAEAHTRIADALVQKGNLSGAIFHYEAALRLAPDSARTANNLAWILATGPRAEQRDGPRAVELAKQAARLAQNPVYLRTLAAAYAESSHFDEAVNIAEQVLGGARARGQSAASRVMEEDLVLYRTRRPLRDPSLNDANH